MSNRADDVASQRWTTAAWLGSLQGVSAILASALLSGEDTDDELEFVRALEGTEDSVHRLLIESGALRKIAVQLANSITALKRAPAATAAELHEKFVLDDKARRACRSIPAPHPAT